MVVLQTVIALEAVDGCLLHRIPAAPMVIMEESLRVMLGIVAHIPIVFLEAVPVPVVYLYTGEAVQTIILAALLEEIVYLEEVDMERILEASHSLAA